MSRPTCHWGSSRRIMCHCTFWIFGQHRLRHEIQLGPHQCYVIVQTFTIELGMQNDSLWFKYLNMFRDFKAVLCKRFHSCEIKHLVAVLDLDYPTALGSNNRWHNLWSIHIQMSLSLPILCQIKPNKADSPKINRKDSSQRSETTFSWNVSVVKTWAALRTHCSVITEPPPNTAPLYIYNMLRDACCW